MSSLTSRVGRVLLGAVTFGLGATTALGGCRLRTEGALTAGATLIAGGAGSSPSIVTEGFAFTGPGWAALLGSRGAGARAFSPLVTLASGST
jgi:hypothetical protein